MKTSARSIAQTTKYRTPSVWNPMAAVRHREESWFYFPEPSMVFKKEEEGEEQDSQMFSLLFQLLHYDFSSKNQYFIKLEMQPLLQELKVIMTNGAREEKTILEKINQMLQEVLRLKEVHENSAFWLSHVETMKQEASVLLERLVKKQSAPHSSLQVSQNTMYQLRNLALQPVTQIQTNINQKITSYENRLHKELHSSEKVLMTEHWRDDVHHLRAIYERMSKEEKESFLQEISITEKELLSTQNMTREQWEVFLANSLPLITVYAKQQDEKEQAAQQQKEILEHVTDFTEVQWQDFKLILMQNVHGEYGNLYAYFSEKKQEHHDFHENWMQEKQNFVDYIQKNQYVSLLKSFLLNSEIINNTAYLTEKEKNAEAEKISPPEKSAEKLTDWIFHLTKNQWQEVNNLFDSPEEGYRTPQLQSVQLKPSAERLILTEEMQRLQKYVQKNRIVDSKSLEGRTPSLNTLEEYRLFNGQQMSSHKLSPEYWRQEMQQFYHMYRSMATEEKEVFLREISATESELLSVQKMTKEQWEVFLTHTLPLISSFVRKQEQVQTTKETAYQKEFLHQLEKFVETQWEKSNLTRSQKEHTDIRNLRVISDLKTQETNSVFHNEINQSFSFNGYGRRLEEIFLEPIGLHSKNRNHLENRKIYRFDRTIDTLMTRQRQRDLHQFVHIYESREAEQKEVFLQELENIQQANLQSTSVSNEKFSLWDVYAFSRTTNQTISELLRNRMMENHQISLLQKVSSHFTTEHWQKHLRQFYQIYESMEAEEKMHFLETITMTEAEMVSVRNMTKDQWEVFLTNVMPLISSYIQKQEETEVTKSTVHQKEFLRQMKELEKVYEENLKFTFVSNEQSSLWNLHAFSRTTNQTVSELVRNRMMKNHQISLLQNASTTLTTERWQKNLRQFYQIYESMEAEEKHRFLEAISMTEAEMVSVRNMTKDQWEVFLTNVIPLISSYAKQQEEIQKTQKLLREKEFLRYVSELNETKWQEFKSILLSTQQADLQSIRSFFEEIQQENPVSVQNVVQEKQAFTEYVQKHQYVSLLRSVLTDFIKSEQKENVIETKEEKRYSEETLRETTEKLAEWVSYLTETQWQEIRDVFTENGENTIVRPVLEMTEQQKPAHDEPVFSAEKRGLISYIAEHVDASVEIIRLIESKESLKNSMEPWVTLPAEEKISKENVVLQEIEQTFTDEQIQDTAESLTEWISYLTENQWQEIKSVLTVHQNEAYISPLLEMVNQQKPFEMEPEFSAEKRGAMIFISQNKQASAGLIKILMNQQTIEKNLSDWVDLTPWKMAQEKLNKAAETAEVSLLPEESAKNSMDVLTKFMSVLTESQWRELRETAVNQHQYRHLQPLLTLSKAQEEHNSFEAEKQTWIDHITENQAAVSEFLNLIQENRKVNLIFQNIRQKAEIESNTTYEKPFITQVSLRITEEQKRAAAQMTVQRIQNWLQQAESERSGNSEHTLRSDVDSQTVFLQNQTVSHHLPGILQRSKAIGKSTTAFNQQGNMQNQIVHNGTLLQTVHHFSGVMNQDTPENALLQPDSYGTAQMVVVKKMQGNAMVQTPPKIPEVILEAKKAMQTEVHDIITRKRSQEPEQADNKTVMELIRRLDVQQKEIEKIRSTQKQMLNITDISVVTEKVMNQMQSQLRLEKMRRGL